MTGQRDCIQLDRYQLDLPHDWASTNEEKIDLYPSNLKKSHMQTSYTAAKVGYQKEYMSTESTQLKLNAKENCCDQYYTWPVQLRNTKGNVK